MDAEERRMAALARQPDRRERELQAKRDAAAWAWELVGELVPQDEQAELVRLEKIMEETNEDQG